jgi:hypothetical protein
MPTMQKPIGHEEKAFAKMLQKHVKGFDDFE